MDFTTEESIEIRKLIEARIEDVRTRQASLHIGFAA